MLAFDWRKARERDEALAKVKAEVNDRRSQRVTQDVERVIEAEIRNVFSGLVCIFFFWVFNFRVLGQIFWRENQKPSQNKKRENPLKG